MTTTVLKKPSFIKFENKFRSFCKPDFVQYKVNEVRHRNDTGEAKFYNEVKDERSVSVKLSLLWKTLFLFKKVGWRW